MELDGAYVCGQRDGLVCRRECEMFWSVPRGCTGLEHMDEDNTWEMNRPSFTQDSGLLNDVHLCVNNEILVASLHCFLDCWLPTGRTARLQRNLQQSSQTFLLGYVARCDITVQIKTWN